MWADVRTVGATQRDRRGCRRPRRSDLPSPHLSVGSRDIAIVVCGFSRHSLIVISRCWPGTWRGMMKAMLRLSLVVAPLLVAATAHAQAPGEVAPQPMPAPMVAPVAATCTSCLPEPVMANRWSIGLSLGSMGISPKDNPDDQTSFAVGELALRFRATPHLELELAVGGGGEKLSNNMDGQREVSGGTFSLRYRFLPERHLNWYLLAGIGGVAVTQKDATDQERQDAQRGVFQLGAGLEYRWSQFALSLELRGMGISEAKNQGTPTVMVGTGTQPPATQPPSSLSPGGYSGAQVTGGASYYF